MVLIVNHIFTNVYLANLNQVMRYMKKQKISNKNNNNIFFPLRLYNYILLHGINIDSAQLYMHRIRYQLITKIISRQ